MKNTLQRRNRLKKQLSVMKPVYICVGLLALIVGILGNILTLVVAVRRKLRQTSTGIYLSYLAIIDILFLYIRIIPQLFVVFNGRRIGFTGAFVCKTTYFSLFTWIIYLLGSDYASQLRECLLLSYHTYTVHISHGLSLRLFY